MAAPVQPALRQTVGGPFRVDVVQTLVARFAARLRRPVAKDVYRPEIDGLRFFAIAIVVVGHLAERMARFFPSAQSVFDAWPMAGHLLQRPGLGVYLFFAISGFVLAGQARKAKAPILSPAFLRSYYARRVLRIEPPYVLLLLATFALIAITGYAPVGARQFDAVPASLGLSLLGSVVYLHDLLWGTYPRLFPPGWSLEIEVQFYLVAPLFFALWCVVSRPASRVWLAAVGLVGGSALSLLAPATAGSLSIDASIVRFFHFFWLGLVLADARSGITDVWAKVQPSIAGLLGWGGLVVYLALPDAPHAETIGAFAYGMALRVAALACIAAMFCAVFAPCSTFKTVCTWHPISIVGGACYSLYLTHLQIIQLTTSAAARWVYAPGPFAVCMLLAAEIALVLVVGLTFYAVIERTFMRRDWPRALGWVLSVRARLPPRPR